MIFRDTIAAVATPPGIGGIGLIRVSGPTALQIARRIFRPLPLENFHSHRLYHGEIVSPETKAVLDEVLIAVLKSPHSYTGEDTLEISCHGGALVLQTVLEAVLQTGARPAERGEFTKRAFLNQRLDLAQAEAVCDIISAQTRPGLAAAFRSLKGFLSEHIDTIRNDIIDILAVIEAAIDFSEDDDIGETSRNVLSQLQEVIDRIASLAATYRHGRIYRLGISVVIAGRPNVGKSSLLNRLLGCKRAIVTSIPGTTRDFIEEAIDIEGIPVRLTDTAGLRQPADAIEREGIHLLWERLENADAVLFLLDGSMELTAEDREFLLKIKDIPLLPVINKSDLTQRLDKAELKSLLPNGAPPAVPISAKYGNGIDILTGTLRALVLKLPAAGMPDEMISHLHQKAALERAEEFLIQAREGLNRSLAPEILALDLHEALDALGEITGKTTPEDILDRIFSNFCIGK